MRSTRLCIWLAAVWLALPAMVALLLGALAVLAARAAEDLLCGASFLLVGYAFAAAAVGLLRLHHWAVVACTTLLALSGLTLGWSVVACVAGGYNCPLLLLAALPLAGATYLCFTVANRLSGWPARALYEDACPSEARQVTFGRWS